MAPLTLTLRRDLHAPRAARMALAELAREVDGRLLTDLSLVVTELVTDRVHHGTSASIRVIVEVQAATAVRGEVSELRDAGEPLGEWKPLERHPNQSELAIVDALTSRWGVYPGSTRTWFELEAGGQVQAERDDDRDEDAQRV